MRSDKYNNSSKETDMFLTREIKYRELQENLDNINREKTKEIKIKLIDIEAQKDSIRYQDSIKEKNNDIFLKEFSNIEENINNDSPKIHKINKTKSNVKIVKLFGWLSIFSTLFLIGYFLIYPFIVNNYLISAKDVFNKSLDNITTQTVNFLKYNGYENVYRDINFNIDTNIEEYEALNNNLYGYTLIYDFNKSVYKNSIYLSYNDIKYGINYYMKDNIYYGNYINSENIFCLKNNYKMYKNYNNPIYNLSKTFNNDFIYVIQQENKFLKSIIEEKKLTRNIDEISVNNETLKVYKNSYSLESLEYKELLEKFKKMIINDDRYLNYLSLKKDLSINEIKEMIETKIMNSEDKSLEINIYTNNNNKFIGLDLVENGFRTIFYYKNKVGDINAYINLNDTFICYLNDNCDSNTKNIYEISGNITNSDIDLKIIHNNKEIININTKNIYSSDISFTYEIINDDKYLKFSGKITKKNNIEINDFDNKNNITSGIDTEESKYINLLKDTNLLDIFDKYYNLINIL